LGTKLKISFGQFGTKLHLRAHLYEASCSSRFGIVLESGLAEPEWFVLICQNPSLNTAY
jgi:hypothetical protein